MDIRATRNRNHERSNKPLILRAFLPRQMQRQKEKHKQNRHPKCRSRFAVTTRTKRIWWETARRRPGASRRRPRRCRQPRSRPCKWRHRWLMVRVRPRKAAVALAQIIGKTQNRWTDITSLKRRAKTVRDGDSENAASARQGKGGKRGRVGRNITPLPGTVRVGRAGPLSVGGCVL